MLSMSVTGTRLSWGAAGAGGTSVLCLKCRCSSEWGSRGLPAGLALPPACPCRMCVLTPSPGALPLPAVTEAVSRTGGRLDALQLKRFLSSLCLTSQRRGWADIGKCNFSEHLPEVGGFYTYSLKGESQPTRTHTPASQY